MASLFREQSLERVSNPDALDNYIRIASPGVWMVIAAVLLLLAAAIVWGIFGTVTVARPGYLVVSSDTTTLWLNEDVAHDLDSGSELQAAGQKGLVTSTAGAPEAVTVALPELEGDTVEYLDEGAWICPFSAAIDLPAGRYDATVTLKTYSPLELIFGGAQTAQAAEITANEVTMQRANASDATICQRAFAANTHDSQCAFNVNTCDCQRVFVENTHDSQRAFAANTHDSQCAFNVNTRDSQRAFAANTRDSQRAFKALTSAAPAPPAPPATPAAPTLAIPTAPALERGR